MIQVLTIAFNHYMGIPFEDYKEKLISAIGLFEIVEDIPDEEREKLYAIEKQTHENANVSFYMLERYLVNKKQDINQTDNTLKIKCLNGQEKNFSEMKISKFLSIAIRRTHQIVLKNFKDYMIEQRINTTKPGENDKDLLELFK